MKTLLTPLVLLVSFLFSSCYTQFATVRHDDGYVVKRGPTDKKYKDRSRDEQEYAYENDDEQDYVYAEGDEQDSLEFQEYYEEDDDFETIQITEYHYSVRPYIYRYRYTHYDPWDYFWYDYHRPYRSGAHVFFSYSHYDPLWTSFYCSPYDSYYYDPWGAWCGYSSISYGPYYNNPYYPTYGYGRGYGHGYYGGRGNNGRGHNRGKRSFVSQGRPGSGGTAR